VVPGHGDDQRLPIYGGHRQPGLLAPRGRSQEPHLNPPRAEGFDLIARVHLHQGKLHLLEPPAKLPHHRRQDTVICGTDEAHRESADLPLVGPDRPAHRLFRSGENPPGLGEEGRPRRGDFHPALGAVQQADADFLLQMADLLAERGLGDVQPLRRPPEMEFLGHGNKINQMP